MTTQKLIILGTGGNCFDIVDAVHALNAIALRYDLVGFLDDDPDRQGTTMYGLPVLGPLSDAGGYDDCAFVNGIGSPNNHHIKDRIVEKAGLSLHRFETIIHPAAVVSRSATLGRGTVVLANNTICANAWLGNHVMVLPGSTVSHDCTVGDYTCMASGVIICADVAVKALCYLGAGCVVRGGLSVEKCALVGAGSVVVKDVATRSIVCGNPAAQLRTLS